MTTTTTTTIAKLVLLLLLHTSKAIAKANATAAATKLFQFNTAAVVFIEITYIHTYIYFFVLCACFPYSLAWVMKMHSAFLAFVFVYIACWLLIRHADIDRHSPTTNNLLTVTQCLKGTRFRWMSVRTVLKSGIGHILAQRYRDEMYVCMLNEFWTSRSWSWRTSVAKYCLNANVLHWNYLNFHFK